MAATGRCCCARWRAWRCCWRSSTADCGRCTRGCCIATGGGIITQPRNLSLLRHLGYIVWLDADPALLARRTSFNQDRPLLAGEEDPQAKLTRLLTERKPIYKALADLRIKTSELTPQESAYGIMESARVFFAKMRR